MVCNNSRATRNISREVEILKLFKSSNVDASDLSGLSYTSCGSMQSDSACTNSYENSTHVVQLRDAEFIPLNQSQTVTQGGVNGYEPPNLLTQQTLFTELPGVGLILLELATGSSLRDLVRNRTRIRPSSPFRLSELENIERQMALGLCQVHVRGVLHGDVKLDNFLVFLPPDILAEAEKKVAAREIPPYHGVSDTVTELSGGES